MTSQNRAPRKNDIPKEMGEVGAHLLRDHVRDGLNGDYRIDSERGGKGGGVCHEQPVALPGLSSFPRGT